MVEIDSNERVVLGASPEWIIEEHIERYRFSKAYASGKRILDLACGSGYGSAILAESGANQVLGVDVCSDVVNYAKQQYQEIEDCHFLVMDGGRLAFVDDSFDIVVSYETIEHVLQPELLLQEFKRVLKPGGKLLISTPNTMVTNFESGWHRLFLKHPLNPFHHREYTLREFLILIERHFEIVFVGGQRFLPWLGTSYFAGITLSFPVVRRYVLNHFYRNLKHSSAKVTSLLPHKVPSYFVLVCQS